MKTMNENRSKVRKIKEVPNLKYGFKPFIIEKEIELGFKLDSAEEEIAKSYRKLTHRVRTISRDNRAKFSNITFCGIHHEKLRLDEIRNHLPISPGRNFFQQSTGFSNRTKLSNLKSEVLSREVPSTKYSNVKSPLGNLLGIDIKNENKTRKEEGIRKKSIQSHIGLGVEELKGGGGVEEVGTSWINVSWVC